MNTSKYVQNLEDVYCHSRSAVTSEIGLSCGSASLPARIINGGKKVLYTAAMTGMLLNNTLPAYADLTVYTGQTSSGLKVGREITNNVVSVLYNKGTIISTIINSGGSAHVYSGGIAYDTRINSSGCQSVYSSGIASRTIIYDGGVQFIDRGGVANSTAVNGILGSQVVRSGGFASNTIVSYGKQILSSGAITNSTTVLSGIQEVYSGGMAQNGVVNGGVQNIYSGGVIYGATITSGIQNVYNGGEAQGTYISFGTQNNDGLVYYTTVASNGVQNINNLFAHSTTITDNGIQNISSGAIASSTIIHTSGTQNILSGGKAISVSNAGTVNLFSGGVLSDYSGNGNLYFYGSNTLKGTTNISNGSITYGNTSNTWLTINNLSANNAVISMNVDLQNQTAGQLHIRSNYSGRTKLSLTNIGAEVNPTSDLGINLIHFYNTATINGTFELIGGQWDEGAYVYKLFQRNDSPDYYLKSTGELTDTFKTILNVPLLNTVMAKTGMNSLNKRMGELRDMNNPANKQGVWVRTYYKDATVDDLIKTDMSLFGVEAGYDWLFNAEDPTKLYAGVMVGYIQVNSIKTKNSIGDNNNGKGDAPSIGLYATLANENGWFIDLAARNFWSKIENTTTTASNNILKFDTKRDLITGSLEVGKSFTRDNGFKFEPKVEVSYINANKETSPVTAGTGNLEYDAANYITGKIALMFAYKKEMANKKLIEPLLELAYNQEFAGKGKVKYGGAETETSLNGGSVEASLGLTMQLADSLYWHALGSYEKGSKLSSWGLNAGVRLGFGGKEK